MTMRFLAPCLLASLTAATLPAAVYSPPGVLCTITDRRIQETSGIAPSLRYGGLVWIHNDSGDSPRIFAVRLADGAVIAEVAISGATAIDWESIASGPGPVPGRSYLYIGETGNNSLNRTNLCVYRIPEPDLPSLVPGQRLTSAPAAKLRFTYPDGNFDCEGLAVHPATASVYLFTKKSAPSGVYRLATNVDDGLSHPCERVGTVSIPNVITDASFSPDGLRLALRTYAAIYEMEVSSPNAPISAFLAKAPVQIAAPREPQGEAVCYAAHGSGIMTVSEGNPVPVYFLEREVPQPFCQVAGTAAGGMVSSASPGDTGSEPVFLRGDSNGDGVIDTSDAIHILATLETGAVFECEDAADANDDGAIGREDAMEVLNWLFGSVDADSLIGHVELDYTPDELGCRAGAPAGSDPAMAVDKAVAAAAGNGEIAVIRPGNIWRYRGAPGAPPAGWNTPSFNDSIWPAGPTGIGYGDGDDATVLAMQGSYLTLYARIEFDFPDPVRCEALRLEVDYDDGFVAYLNGVEVARRGLGQPGATTSYNQPATLREAGVAESIPICRELLVAGRNVLAFEVHNASIDSSDLSFIPALIAQLRPALIAVGDPWRYRGAPGAPPAGWNQPTFNDSAWAVGPTGIGYGDGDDATVVAMEGSFLTLYARKAFQVADPSAAAGGLTLEIDYDDGFVAYLNGVEVARRGLGQPGTPTSYNQPATSHEAGTPEVIALPPGSLVAGRNVLAFEVHNTSLSSSDLTFKPALTAGMPSTLIAVGDPWRYRGAPGAPPAGWNQPTFNDSAWSVGPTGIGYGDGDDATVVAMEGSFLTLYARKAFQVADPSAAAGGLTLEIDYDDGFVAYLNGVEVARRGLGQPGTPTPYNQPATSHEAGTPEVIALPPGSLVAGRNVLAFEVHNTSLSSSDLTFKPVLTARPAR